MQANSLEGTFALSLVFTDEPNEDLIMNQIEESKAESPHRTFPIFQNLSPIPSLSLNVSSNAVACQAIQFLCPFLVIQLLSRFVNRPQRHSCHIIAPSTLTQSKLGMCIY
jgi:hypothetical protein